MTRIAILIAGALGTVILARTAAFYVGEDLLAFSMVMLMAVALFAGVAELLMHARRLKALHAELSELTREPTLEGVDSASPLLRALLRARLDRVSLGVPRASFTPYLIGLLVMLGLLGTFMGLFETLRGARLALTASSDVAALREGLSTPMSGLMRSFGTSAAGVSASAMLGLAAVFARRAAGELGVQLHAAASGPFARFASSHRQLVALEQLAVQGEALPAAAAALTQAGQEIMALRSEWLNAHTQSSEAVSRRLLEATESVQRTVQAGVEQSASATHRAMAAQLSAHLESVTARLDAQVTDSQASDSERRASLEQLERSAEQARARHVEAVLGALQEQAERDLAGQRAQREEALALEAQRNQQWVATQASMERSLMERMSAVTAVLEGTVGRLATAEAERAKLLTDHVDGMSAEMRRAFSAAAERDSERAATLAQVAGTLRTELSAAADVMRDRLGASADADAARAREAQAMFEELKGASSQIAEAARTQSTALQQFVAATEGRTETLETRSQERLEALLTRIRDMVDTQAARLGELEQGLRASQTETALTLSQQLGAHAQELSASLGQTSSLVQDAAGLVQAGGAELTAVAEMFAEAVDRQREAAREWLENLGHVERAVADAGEGAAADALGHHLARTHEIFDRQLRFQQELFEQLRHGRMNGQARETHTGTINGIENDVSA